ncbi:protoporphyrinogen oxidase [uncultured Nocardioides sp.]|uniref:Coproporphyrinogen III oxidase n=1 Tax=uncultured Nocardioides sp. TaxID=198441 RepID=A0A6J4NNZ5_9ACTN|nr:protoporphyrinogen oxidase [uncultured Nocardioides sp.]CAA9393510.1 MAG: Protoporphyrinogen IX oxidase, aerobic, HemY [uncultured Nocardioides sp.]
MTADHRIVVVGGGIAGLTAAHVLGADHDVLLLEGSPAVGGKLRTVEVAGVRVDVGAEAMLNRRPEGVELARELGLPVVHPTAAASRVWSRGALRPLPRSLMGVPFDLDELAASGVLSAEGLDRARREVLTPWTGDDVSVGDLVAARLGEEVVDRLVEPLLGGVYAGRAHEISTYAAMPQLAAMAARGSLLEQAAAVPASDVPVFAGVEGGLGSLPEALVAAGRFELRTGAVVRALRHVPGGLELTVGSARDPETLRADRVMLATPPAAAARLLGAVAPDSAAALATVGTASVAVTTLAFRTEDLPDLAGMSGFLVPPVEGLRIKASTFSFAKWDWVRASGDGLLVLRTSLGRHGEETSLQATDAQLVAASLADLRATVGIRSAPVETHVQRWGGALPQYSVGHQALVARVRAGLVGSGVTVCGAAYDGVGIPAVIGSARRAAALAVAAE